MRTVHPPGPVWNLAPGLSSEDLPWEPAGPPEDRRALLVASIAIGPIFLRLMAVEVLADRHGDVVAKADDLEPMLFALEVASGCADALRSVLVHGRRYLVLAASPARA